jgi:LPPG:FO 2-phospho-L-lactate transferase
VSVAVVAGGVGAARLLRGLVRAHPPEGVTAIANVADDVVLHGLHVSPDLDTVTYTLAGATDDERGWGLAGETWNAMDALGRYPGAVTWFNLGDRDLATHLFRTHRLAQGAPLSAVTAEITAAWGLTLQVLPVTDDPVRTRVRLVTGEEVGFQEYFVRLRHDVAVASLRFDGVERARPGPGVLEALAGAERVVIAPSNPLVSVEPVLAVPGVRDAVAARRDHVVAVSPIVAGATLKGPADRMLAELGHEPSVVGVARLYAPLAATLVIDEADRDLAPEVERTGMRAVVAPTVMREVDDATRLAEVVLAGIDGADR